MTSYVYHICVYIIIACKHRRSSDNSGRFPVFHPETDADAIQEAHSYIYIVDYRPEWFTVAFIL